MKDEDLIKYTTIFKAISNPIRLKILMHIANCNDCTHKHNISELAHDCDVDFSVVSRHLKSLKDCAILESVKQKNDVIYKFNRKEFKNQLLYFSKLF